MCLRLDSWNWTDTPVTWKSLPDNMRCKCFWWHIWEHTVILTSINCLFSFYLHTFFGSIIFQFLHISGFPLSLFIFYASFSSITFHFLCIFFPLSLFIFESTLVFCAYFTFRCTLIHDFRNALYMKFPELKSNVTNVTIVSANETKIFFCKNRNVLKKIMQFFYIVSLLSIMTETEKKTAI